VIVLFPVSSASHEESTWDESTWDESTWDESTWDESTWDESAWDECTRDMSTHGMSAHGTGVTYSRFDHVRIYTLTRECARHYNYETVPAARVIVTD
jgi:hypothetical protein